MLRSKRFRKGMLIAIAAILVVVLAAGCGKKSKEADGKVVASYKDGQVTEAEFEKYTKFMSVMDPQTAMYLSIPQMKEQVLRQYIGYKILEGRSKLSKDEIKKIEESAKSYYDQIKPMIDANEEVKKTFEEAGIDEEYFKSYVKQLDTIRISEENKVTDDMLAKKFEESKNDLITASVRHILIMSGDQGEVKRTDEEALKLANDVKKKLEEGGDWTELAKKYSEDGGSKENGGLYENKNTGEWVPEFKEAAETQEIGKIGDPVKTSYGYHVIMVEKREMPTLEKDKEQVKQMLVSESIGKFMTDELPGLITEIKLPEEEQPKPEEGATNGGQTNEGQTNEGKTDEGSNGATNEGAKNDAAKNNADKDGATQDGAAKDNAAGNETKQDDAAKANK